MIMNVSLLSILLNTESVAQNCWKGISFSWRTLSGTFLREHLQHYPNIKQRYEMLHYTAIPSSACVAYRMNFNDNFDIFWGRRKLFQEDGIHWSQLGAKVQCKNVLHGLRILPLKSTECIQIHVRGDTETHGVASRSDTVHQWKTPEDKEPVASFPRLSQMRL